MVQTTTMQTLYDILGVPRDADQDKIKAAYLRLVKVTHPDKGGDAHLFSLIQSAYDTLRDPTARQSYDRSLSYESTNGSSYQSSYTPPPPPPPPPTRGQPMGAWAPANGTGGIPTAPQEPVYAPVAPTGFLEKAVFKASYWYHRSDRDRVGQILFPKVDGLTRTIYIVIGGLMGAAVGSFWHFSARLESHVPDLLIRIPSLSLPLVACAVLFAVLFATFGPGLCHAVRKGGAKRRVYALCIPVLATAGAVAAVNILAPVIAIWLIWEFLKK